LDNLEYDILIGLEFSTVCNAKCTYCYARNNYQQDWQKEMKEDNFNKLFSFIDILSRKKRVKIVLLGGEPTQSKYFNKLLKLENVIFEVYTNLINIDNLVLRDDITYTVSYHSEYIPAITKNLETLFLNGTKNINVDLMINKDFKPSHKFLDMIETINKFRTLFNVRLEVIEGVDSNGILDDVFLNNIKESTEFFRELFKGYDLNYYSNFKELYQNNKFCNMPEYNIDFYGNLKQTCSDKEITNVFNQQDDIDKLIKKMMDCIIFCKKGIICPCENLLKNTSKKII